MNDMPIPKINPDDCPEVYCTYCDNPTFMLITRIKAVSVFQQPPNGAHFNQNSMFCTNCHIELDLERAKKWAFLPTVERIAAKDQMLKAIKEKEEKNARPAG